MMNIQNVLLKLLLSVSILMGMVTFSSPQSAAKRSGGQGRKVAGKRATRNKPRKISKIQRKRGKNKSRAGAQKRGGGGAVSIPAVVQPDVPVISSVLVAPGKEGVKEVLTVPTKEEVKVVSVDDAVLDSLEYRNYVQRALTIFTSKVVDNYLKYTLTDDDLKNYSAYVLTDEEKATNLQKILDKKEFETRVIAMVFNIFNYWYDTLQLASSAQLTDAIIGENFDIFDQALHKPSKDLLEVIRLFYDKFCKKSEQLSEQQQEMVAPSEEKIQEQAVVNEKALVQDQTPELEVNPDSTVIPPPPPPMPEPKKVLEVQKATTKEPESEDLMSQLSQDNKSKLKKVSGTELVPVETKEKTILDEIKEGKKLKPSSERKLEVPVNQKPQTLLEEIKAGKTLKHASERVLDKPLEDKENKTKDVDLGKILKEKIESVRVATKPTEEDDDWSN
jgi:hypothetical protein